MCDCYEFEDALELEEAEKQATPIPLVLTVRRVKK
jgi:hypothetical protein